MLLVTDFLSDLSDDICIKGDILMDQSASDSVINAAERRIVAKGTDFLIDDIAASLESFLFRTKTPTTAMFVQTAISNALLADRLFQPSDFSINIIEQNTKTMYILLVFNSPLIGDSSGFRIVVDVENQRIYRG